MENVTIARIAPWTITFLVGVLGLVGLLILGNAYAPRATALSVEQLKDLLTYVVTEVRTPLDTRQGCIATRP